MPRGKQKEFYSLEQQAALNEVKRVLCIAIRNNQERLRGRKTSIRAEILGTSKSRLSEVYKHQYDKLSVTQLFHYLILLNPNFKMQLLFSYYDSKPEN